MNIFLKYTLLLTFFILLKNHVAQMPATEELQARFTQELWGGVNVHSQGFGISLNYAKFITYKKKRFYTIDIVGMHHEKEYKIFGSIDENAKKFVYGKLNSFYTLRPGIGSRKMIFEKLRDKGLQIALNFSYGPAIGLTKPIYLEVLKINGYGQVIGVSTEKYDPESHNLYNIYGRGPWSKGLSEARLYPGLFCKLGLEFEYSDERDIIKAIEIGATIDAYPWAIPIMTEINNHFIYPTVFINIMLGLKNY